VSTADKNQTVENQLRDLLAVAERQGWTVTATFTDEGISGVNGAPATTPCSRAWRARTST
jgi:hypothetical protein